MKRTAIALVLLALIGAGLFIANRYAADRAALELDAILTPKFEEAGVRYGDLEVSPASGTITLHDITLEDEEVSVGLLSVRSTLEDLLAAANGMPEFLHGLHVQAEDVTLVDGGDVVNLGSGELHIDALIDIRAIQEDPEEWILGLMEQDDVNLEVSGNDWIVKSKEAARELGLSSSLIRVDAFDGRIGKQGESLSAAIDLESPDFGSLAFEVKGTEEELGHFSMEVADISFEPDKDLQVRLGSASMSMTGVLPIEAILEEDFEELMTGDPDMQWSVRVRDFIVYGKELREEGFPESRLVLNSMEHDFKVDAGRLATTMDLRSNLGNGSLEVDLAIASIDPPVMEFRTFEVELDDLHEEARRALDEVPLPLEPRGETGYGFSYTGPLMGLLGMDL